MIVEIVGYYGSTDRHTIVVEQIETVSMAKPRHGGTSDNVSLEIRLTNQILVIDYLSYKEECKRAYDAIIQALMVHNQKYIVEEKK